MQAKPICYRRFIRIFFYRFYGNIPLNFLKIKYRGVRKFDMQFCKELLLTAL
jgi:hypothetical protein